MTYVGPALQPPFTGAHDRQAVLTCREDISICRTSENKKCRLGEGGFGIVYKALMNGVDEVAIKLVKAEKPTTKELTLFHKEVSNLIVAGMACTPGLRLPVSHS